MDLLLTWFTKFNSLFSLERSQGYSLKFIVEESVSGCGQNFGNSHQLSSDLCPRL